MVRGAGGGGLRVRIGPEPPAAAGLGTAAAAFAEPGAGQWAGVAAVPGLPLPDTGELEPEATGGGEGGMAAGPGAGGQPAIRSDEPGAGAGGTSAATLPANQLRLYWALFAAALLEVLRQVGLAGTELATAQFGTIRALLLKVAALVRVSVRRICVSLSSVCPRQELFAHSLSRLREVASG